MLPTQEEQGTYLSKLIDKQEELSMKSGSVDIYCEHKLNGQQSAIIAQEYAKWYATKVIEHCTEVAELKFGEYIVAIDKQSILNTINKL